MPLTCNDALAEAWMDLFDARYWCTYDRSLQLLGLTPDEVKSSRALDLMSKVISHCEDYSPRDFIQILELLIEAGRCVGRELDALRIAWACIGVSELDWAPLELMVKLGEPTLSQIGRQGNANSVDNGTLSSIPGTHLIAKQLGVSRAILLGDQQPEESRGLWGHLSNLSASLRSYPIRMEKLETADKLKLQVVLLSGLQRAAYHIRSLLIFRAVFHPAFTSPEDGISSLTIWDGKYFERFCQYWSIQPGFEDLQWFVLGHAVSNLKQRWEGFACAAIKDLSGVSIDDNDFVCEILARITRGTRHLVIDRCEKVMRLLNWLGRPAAARSLCELLQTEILKENYKASPHTVFRAMLQFGRMNILTTDLKAAFYARVTKVTEGEKCKSVDFVNLLNNPNEIRDRGSLLVTQSLLISGMDESLSAEVRNVIGTKLQSHLNSLGQCWNQPEQDDIPVPAGLAMTIPERRFELRWWLELSELFLRLGARNINRSIAAASHVVSFDSTENELEEQVRQLQTNCAEDEDLAIAPIQLFIYADTLIRVSGRPKENPSFKQHLVKIISGGEVPLKHGEEGSLQSEKINALKRLLPPVQFVQYMDMCVRAWANNESEFPSLCDTAVHEVIRIAYDEICPGADRKEFIKSIQQLHQTIADTTIDVYGPSSTTVRPIVLAEWLELLDHRMLIEEYLTGIVREDCQSNAIVQPGAWGATEVWSEKGESRENVALKVEEWESLWRSIAGTRGKIVVSDDVSLPSCYGCKAEESTENEADLAKSSAPFRIRQIGDVPEEFRDVEGFRKRLKECLTSDSIWIKTAFDQLGRLAWWAFRPNPNTRELKCIASGQSTRGAKRRIELETRILDAKIELAYAALDYSHDQWDGIWNEFDPRKFLRDTLPRTLHEISRDERKELMKNAREALERLSTARVSKKEKSLGCAIKIPKLPDTCSLAESFLTAILTAIESNTTGSIDRITNGWLEVVSVANGGWLPSVFTLPERPIALDTILNRSCSTFQESIAGDLNFDDLERFLTESSDVLMTMDGPLSSIPIEYVTVANVPLYQRVRSISNLLSTSLAVSKARGTVRDEGCKELFAVAWERVAKRNAGNALNVFHAKMHQVCEDSRENNSSWECCSAVDSPRATPAIIESTLVSRSFPIIAMAGHGELGRRSPGAPHRKSGIQVASQKTNGTGIYLDKYERWHGTGDLQGNEALVLCSCLVGRLFDDGDDGIRGLFTETFLSGGRIFCGARWPVHECYSAIFCIEVVRALMDAIDSPASSAYEGPFRVARIVNQIRKKLTLEMPGALHTLSAFTCFGLSTPVFQSSSRA